MSSESKNRPACLSRRDFLLFGGGVGMTIALASVAGCGRGLSLRMVTYPRKQLGRLSELRLHKPVAFLYPYDHPHCASFLVKLGVPAGGGAGPDQDVVAFNALCTHQGFTLAGAYDPTHRLAGPCSLHLSTFDLTRHGLIVAGHATQSLPQVVLETDGDVIYATGMMGLIYGFSTNLSGKRAEVG